MLFFRSFHQVLRIQASQKSQMSGFLSAVVLAVMEQIWLRHASFPKLWLKWCDISHKKFVSV
jgi:hypothetical protein